MAVCPACNARYEAAITFCPKDGAQVVAEDGAEVVAGLVGQVIADRYRLTKKLGEGGMGEVYEASHIYIEKRVALKLLRPEIMSNQEAVTRFYQEARSASQIGHENIVAIDDFGKLPDGRVYLTMEFLEGESLNDALQNRMDQARAIELTIQVCKGLGAAHAKNIVHRDMKPENVFLTHHEGREVAKILDFGIAKVSGTEGNQHLTRTGTIFGTPHYMSPEQALGKSLDHRTDIYSVGVIMYEMFTGSVPFKAESFMGILTQHLTTTPKAPHEQAPERQIPFPIEHIILRAMAKNPDERYQRIEELINDLERVRAELGAGTLGSAMPPGYGAGPMPGMPPGVSPAGLVAPPHPAAPYGPPGAPGPWTGSPSGPVGLPPTAPMPVPTTLPPGAVPGPAMATAPPMRAAPPMPPRPMAQGAYGMASAPVKKKGSGLVIGIVIGLVALLGGGGAVVYLFQDDIFGATPAPKPGAKGPVAAATGVPTPPVPAPTPPPSAAPWTSVQLTSTPMGAAIVHDNREIAKTPAKVRVPPNRSITYVVRLEGFQDKTLELAAGETANKHVMLEKPGSAAPAPKVKPKPRPQAAPPPPAAKDPYERLK